MTLWRLAFLLYTGPLKPIGRKNANVGYLAYVVKTPPLIQKMKNTIYKTIEFDPFSVYQQNIGVLNLENAGARHNWHIGWFHSYRW